MCHSGRSCDMSLSQITMTTGWLLLLLVVVVSSQSVDGQPTTDDEVCSGGGLLSSDRELLIKLQRDVEKILQRLGKPQQNVYQVTLMKCVVKGEAHCRFHTNGHTNTALQENRSNRATQLC